MDRVLDDLADLAVTLDGDGDDAAGARGDLLNVANSPWWKWLNSRRADIVV